ncbi:hypothetical protein QY895_01345 [Latilactobacillus sakei]
MLPTILSRLQVIDLANLPKEMVRQQFEEAQILPTEAQLLSHLTSDLTRAQQLLAEDWLMQVVAKITSWAQKVAQKGFGEFCNDSNATTTVIDRSVPTKDCLKLNWFVVSRSFKLPV